MKYEYKDNILLFFQSVHDEYERAELEEVYHYAEEWHKLKSNLLRTQDRIKTQEEQNFLSAMSAGTIAGIINIMSEADKYREEDTDDE